MPYALALGFFDGIHLGHAALLRRTLELSSQRGLTPAVCTLDRSPASVFGGDGRLINTPDDRRYILHRFFGIDQVFELTFDRAMQTLPPADFLPLLLKNYSPAALVCGRSYTFGAGGGGNWETLRTGCLPLGIDCAVLEEVLMDGEPVSSTRIRSLIAQGDTLGAARLLGHPHILSGRVEHGRSLGHTLGFATANLPIPVGVVAPRYGVYAVRVLLDGHSCCGVANVGKKPTVGGATAGLEVHIFDFAQNIYGRQMTVEFDRFLRPERRFADLEELTAQVQRDKLAAAEALSCPLSMD